MKRASERRKIGCIHTYTRIEKDEVKDERDYVYFAIDVEKKREDGVEREEW
jgi:hypothetical protein